MSATFMKHLQWVAAQALFGLALTAVVLFGGAAQAAPPKMCVPDAFGVPGSSGPPNWWDPGQTQPGGGANIFAYQPFDPRWRGAMVLDYGSGSISEVEYRAVYDGSSEGTQYLLLSWQVKSVMQFSIDNTALYAGFYKPPTPDPEDEDNKGALLKVTLKNTFSGVDSNFPGNPPAVRSSIESGTTYFNAALTTGTGSDPAAWITPANPAWLSGTLRAWINAQTNPYTWTVQLRVPLDAAIVNGLDLQAAGFRMWHYAQVEALLSATMPPAIVPFTWPRPDPGQPVLTYASFQQGILQKYPDASTSWGDFALVANPAADATCSGVYLATDHIGTRSSQFNSEIKLNADNTFFAEPENKTTTAINNGVLSATFRIANWGSQVGATSAASWTAPTALTNVNTGAGGVGGTGAAVGGFATIEGKWNPSAKLDDICPFIGTTGAGGLPGRPDCSPDGQPRPPTRMLHQCMLVELQGPGLNFVRDSAIRNMNFVKASRFEREAEISVVGMPGLAAGKRDVFLYVERRNMPRFTPGGSGGEQPNPDRSQLQAPEAGMADFGTAVSRQPSDEELAASVPTWIVHAYHDSGEKIHLSNKDYKVLTPQTAFGYFVSHEGAFEGWADVIEGADRLREDLYKVAPPSDGAVRVKTIVQAVEAGEQPVGQPWPPSAPPFKWWWVALLVLALLALIILLRRKSP